MIEALIFDLDDTLYTEYDFVVSGYRAVAHEVALRRGRPEEQVFSDMLTTFKCEGRGKVLEMVANRYSDSSLSVAEMVEIYRRHQPAIQMPVGYDNLLRRFRHDYKLGIITDGLPEVQMRKVQALHLGSAVDKIIYTWEHGREMEKPHPFSFRLMLDSLGTSHTGALFIGDNPHKDCRGAHNAGMRFVQVAKGGGAGEAAIYGQDGVADFAINTLHELPDVLRQLS